MLVPLAWLVVAAAHRGVIGTDAIFVAHLVMAAFIGLFALSGWSEMQRGALRAWRTVLVVGLGVTVAGVLGFWFDEQFLLAISLIGWMVLPAAGLVYTGWVFDSARTVYYLAGTLSAVGAGAYLLSPAVAGVPVSAGIALVGLGQTIGIADATARSD